MQYTLTVPYPPSNNRMYRLHQNMIRLTQEAHDYKREVNFLALSKGIRKPFPGSVKVSLNVYRPRKAGDLDGRIKALLDSMQGTFYVDDKQIVEIHAYRFDDKENPRVEVTVLESETA